MGATPDKKLGWRQRTASLFDAARANTGYAFRNFVRDPVVNTWQAIRGTAKNNYVPPEKPGSEELPQEVFAAELAAIDSRRQCIAGIQPLVKEESSGEPRPDVGRGLIGLALSGGGIRSATFALGVLQVLFEGRKPATEDPQRNEKLCRFSFCHVDYMSTVSGGGYMGSCVSATFATLAKWRQRNPNVTTLPSCPFVHTGGQAESATFKHLRDNSKYLAQRGLLSLLRIPALFLRGLMVNFTVLFPYLLVAAILVVMWAHDPIMKDSVKALALQGLRGTAYVAIVLLAIMAASPVLWRIFFGGITNWKLRDVSARWVLAFGLLVVGVVALIAFQPAAIAGFHSLGELLSKKMSIDTLTAIATGMAAILSIFSTKMAQRTSGIASRIGLYAFGALGPIILYLVYLNLCRWLVFPDTAPRFLEWADGFSQHPVSKWVTVLLSWLSWGVAWISALIKAGWTFAWEGIAQGWSSVLWQQALSSAPAGSPGEGLAWAAPRQADLITLYGFIGGGIIAATWLWFDMNATSFHVFYRDRLSKAFLFDPWPSRAAKELPHEDSLRLSELDTEYAPYHLINTTLNIQRSKTANLRGRNGASFVFSKEYTGGQLTGYCRTRLLEDADPHVNLGTAMAISGAAVAPNMGKQSTRGLRFVMALLNIRLGYWLRNPQTFSMTWFSHLRKRKRLSQLFGWVRKRLSRLFGGVNSVGPLHLLKELFGDLDETEDFINLTDGGQFDNLGLYELVRRRCKLIVSIDAEADKNMTFNGLAEAIRLVRIDMGVRIRIDVDSIRRDPKTGKSGVHFAVGEILYGENNGAPEKGYLLYLKSSLTGDENVDIQEYQAQKADFPHETTADQFFDERQFEAYRALGWHVADQVFSLAEDERLRQHHCATSGAARPLYAVDWLQEFCKIAARRDSEAMAT